MVVKLDGVRVETLPPLLSACGTQSLDRKNELSYPAYLPPPMPDVHI